MANSTIREVAVLWLEERIDWVEHSLRDENSLALRDTERLRRLAEHEVLTYLLEMTDRALERGDAVQSA